MVFIDLRMNDSLDRTVVDPGTNRDPIFQYVYIL
jgi:hypothetical protein